MKRVGMYRVDQPVRSGSGLSKNYILRFGFVNLI